MRAMGKQEDFVLRALEERDVRFVRLWFTDVLGSLKSVAVAPAELEGAFTEGIGFDGSAIEGFARVYEADMLAKPDPSTFQILPWRGEGPSTARMFCDIVMPDGSTSRTPIRGSCSSGSCRRPPTRATRSTPTPRSSSTSSRTGPVTAASPSRSTAAATSTTPAERRARLPPRGDHDARVDGHLGRVQPPRGRSRAAGDRPPVRRCAVDRRQHHDLPRRGQGGRAVSQGVYASFMPKPFTEFPGSAMHTHLSLFEGDRNVFFEVGGGVPPVQDRSRLHRRTAPARGRDHGRHQPVGQLLQAARGRGRGAVVRLLGPQQPLGAGPCADVQADQGPVDAGRAASHRLGREPVSRVRRDARGRA